MGMAAVLFNSAKSFEQIVSIPDSRPHVKSGENGQVISKKKIFKDLINFIHVNSPGARADTTHGIKLC